MAKRTTYEQSKNYLVGAGNLGGLESTGIL